MTEQEDDPLTPAQTKNFRLLRWWIFFVAVVGLALLMWQSLRGGPMQALLQRSALDSTGRASALALSTLGGLVFAWFAAGNIARLLTRQIR